MSLPIDTQKVSFIAMSEPSVQTDFKTGVPRMAPTGEPFFLVKVLAFTEDAGGEVITVKVAGPQKGVGAQVPVKVHNLQLKAWSMPDDEKPGSTKSGISYSSDAIVPEGVAKS